MQVLKLKIFCFTNLYSAVPLTRYEAIFLAKGKRSSDMTHLQLTLTLTYDKSIHKVQDPTLDTIVVDLKGGKFSPGQTYVAFSRVMKLTCLYILHLNNKAFKAS